MSIRKLATIARIEAIEPHLNADNLELATVRGWRVCIKKGEFQPSDLCVYCEIDSVLPDRPEFEFLRARGFRIKTIRLRGELSQGICFPLDVLPGSREGGSVFRSELQEGDDVTAELGVTLYESPLLLKVGGDAIGVFPHFIPKTDEERIQNCYRDVQKLIEQRPELRWVYTEKLNGTSVTMFLKDGDFGVCSRNLRMKDTPGSALWNVARLYKIEDKLRALGLNMALQGELIGPGIQGNYHKLTEPRWCVFNAFDIARARHLQHGHLIELLNELRLPSVPVLDFDVELPSSLADILGHAEGESVINPAQHIAREGVVWRTMTPAIGESPAFWHRVSFKAISNQYLLRHDI